MNEKRIKVKRDIIETIYEALKPVYYRLDAILKDCVTSTLPFSDLDKSILLEYCACTTSLKLMFEFYLQNSELQELEIPEPEYLTILSMSKVVETASRSCISNVSFWTH